VQAAGEAFHSRMIRTLSFFPSRSPGRYPGDTSRARTGPIVTVMRIPSARSFAISVTALGGAVVWGLVELVALQWSRFSGRFRIRSGFRAS